MGVTFETNWLKFDAVDLNKRGEQRFMMAGLLLIIPKQQCQIDLAELNTRNEKWLFLQTKTTEGKL